MSGLVVLGGIVVLFVIGVHVFFKLIKLTLGIFAFGVVAIGTIAFFKQSLGIDLLAMFSNYVHNGS